MGNPGDACRGSGDASGRSNSSDRSRMAPQNGSHLGGWGQKTPPAVKSTGAAASTGPAAPATAADSRPLAAEGAKEGSGGGSRHCLPGAVGGREEGKGEEQGKGSVLAPWPSRARTRPYFSVAFTGEDPGKGAKAEKGGERGPLASGSYGVAEGSVAAASAAAVPVAGRSGDAKNEPPPFTPPPFTPSPRITLKRRLSGSWLSAVSGGRSSGGGGGGGGGGAGGFWGRELRKGGSPRLGSSEKGEGRATQRREDRPPPLPPPPPPPGAPTGGVLPSVASPSLSTSASRSLSAAHPRQPAARPSPPLRASSDPSPSGGLRISLPLLLQPPPAGLDVGANAAGVPAGELDQGEQRQLREQLQERRQHHLGELVPPPPPPPPPSQPVFFLQVPATAAVARVAQGGLEGQGWDAQYLSAVATGENVVQEAAPATYGRRSMARSSSAGEAARTHGDRGSVGRQEVNPDDIMNVRGGDGPQEVDSISWESNSVSVSSSSSSSSAPTSFGRAHRRAPPAPSPAGKLVPHLVLVSLNLDDGRGAGEGNGEKMARVVRAEAMDIFTAKQVLL